MSRKKKHTVLQKIVDRTSRRRTSITPEVPAALSPGDQLIGPMGVGVVLEDGSIDWDRPQREPRTVQIQVRLSPAEHAAWCAYAELDGRKLSDWIRQQVAHSIGWKLPVKGVAR